MYPYVPHFNTCTDNLRISEILKQPRFHGWKKRLSLLICYSFIVNILAPKSRDITYIKHKYQTEI